MLFDAIRDLNSRTYRPDLPPSKGGKGLVIGEGKLVVERLLMSQYPVDYLIGFPHKLDSLEVPVPESTTVVETDRETLAEVAGFDMHRGLVAAAHRVPEKTLPQVIEHARTLIVLEGVADHENIGAMFRNAAGLGIDGVLLGSGCADPLYRRAIRVSMGHVLRLPWAKLEGGFTTWHRNLEVLSQAGFHTVALTPDESAQHLADALVDSSALPWVKVALMVGAEGPGLTEHAMRAADVRARIPMAPGTDSLNVATAAAVACWERMRVVR